MFGRQVGRVLEASWAMLEHLTSWLVFKHELHEHPAFVTRESVHVQLLRLAMRLEVRLIQHAHKNCNWGVIPHSNTM